MKKTTFFALFLIFTGLFNCQQKTGMIESLMKKSRKFDSILSQAERHKLQIIYTQIDRDEHNKAKFTTYKYRVDNNEYFYPASTIKMPVAALALEKINDLSIDGLTSKSVMQIDSGYSGQTSVYEDSTSKNGLPSIEHYIKKLFLVSDNDAYNRLYEFVGQREVNERLEKKGFENIRITHRLSIPLAVEENRYTNPMSFYQGDKLVYQQGLQYNQKEIQAPQPIYLGEGFMSSGTLVEKPMEFTFKNAVGLEAFHDMLLRLVFPENFLPHEQFHLNESDYEFLYHCMSKYPGEAIYPQYDKEEYYDDYCKFLLYGSFNQGVDPNIRIFNKVGMAYGFLIDIAYIVDFEKKIEFVVGAVINVNSNNILNDGIYDYDSVGFPIMRDIGQLFYNYEMNRTKTNQPDLSKYNLKPWEK